MRVDDATIPPTLWTNRAPGGGTSQGCIRDRLGCDIIAQQSKSVAEARVRRRAKSACTDLVLAWVYKQVRPLHGREHVAP
jgi:hypothetical protein